MPDVPIAHECTSDQCRAKGYVMHFEGVNGPSACAGCGTLYMISIRVGADGQSAASIGFEGPLNTLEDPLCECHHPHSVHAHDGGTCALSRCGCRQYRAFQA
jgi:hypothetical protein